MIPFEQLSGILNSIIPFTDEEVKLIAERFRAKRVSRGQLLLAGGEVCREFYIVCSGCIRTYFTDKNGNERTRYIMPQNYIGTALASFISQSPSFERMDALNDSELLAISFHDFYRLAEEMPRWGLFYRKILEMAYSFQTHKIESIVTRSAQQRFEQALTETPELFQLVSNSVLASYLDMSPETLSRLKSKRRF